MKDGDFVTIDYVARVKETGEIFDLTREDVAKQENVYNEKITYKPVTVVVGANFVIRGLDEALHEMEVGNKKTIEILPEKAFGKRSEELVKLMPESQFRQQNMGAVPGAFVNINNIRGRIASVAGGRVKVDFNHPLAGKTLLYDLEVKAVVTDRAEKAMAVVSYFTGKEMNVRIIKTDGDEEVEIEANIDMERRLKELVAQTISKYVGISTMKFLDVFRIEKAEKAKDAENSKDGTKNEAKNDVKES